MSRIITAKINSKVSAQGNRFFMFAANGKTFTASAAVTGQAATAQKGDLVEIEAPEFRERGVDKETGEAIMTFNYKAMIVKSKGKLVDPFEVVEPEVAPAF